MSTRLRPWLFLLTFSSRERARPAAPSRPRRHARARHRCSGPRHSTRARPGPRVPPRLPTHRRCSASPAATQMGANTSRPRPTHHADGTPIPPPPGFNPVTGRYEVEVQQQQAQYQPQVRGGGEGGRWREKEREAPRAARHGALPPTHPPNLAPVLSSPFPPPRPCAFPVCGRRLRLGPAARVLRARRGRPRRRVRLHPPLPPGARGARPAASPAGAAAAPATPAAAAACARHRGHADSHHPQRCQPEEGHPAPGAPG